MRIGDVENGARHENAMVSVIDHPPHQKGANKNIKTPAASDMDKIGNEKVVYR